MYLSCNKVILSVLNSPFATDNLNCVMKREMYFIQIHFIWSNCLAENEEMKFYNNLLMNTLRKRTTSKTGTNINRRNV